MRVKVLTKTLELIFYWNVASTRFDLICLYLAPEYSEKRIGSGHYHLKCDGMTFQILDLMTNEKLLPEEDAKNILSFGSMPIEFEELENEYFSRYMSDPFTYLRPCLVFKNLEGYSSYIPIELILSQLATKLSEHDKGST